MKSGRLSQMKRGWFVGNFEPSVYRTPHCEVAIKQFHLGDKEQAHYHKVATEVTLVVSGQVKMFNKIWVAGDIVVVEPGDVTSFEALSDSVLSVVKVPAVVDDKYIVENE